MLVRAMVLMVFASACLSCAVDDEKATTTQFRPSAPLYNNHQSRYNRPYSRPAYNQPYYGRPNSRQYYNPYDFHQPYGSNPYSDYDQYYVPPNQYYIN